MAAFGREMRERTDWPSVNAAISADRDWWRARAIGAVDVLRETFENIVLGSIVRYGRVALRFARWRACSFLDNEREELYQSLLFVARVTGPWPPQQRCFNAGNHWERWELLSAAQLSGWRASAVDAVAGLAWPRDRFVETLEQLRIIQRLS